MKIKPKFELNKNIKMRFFMEAINEWVYLIGNKNSSKNNKWTKESNINI